jgi:hypothetical protein
MTTTFKNPWAIQAAEGQEVNLNPRMTDYHHQVIL